MNEYSAAAAQGLDPFGRARRTIPVTKWRRAGIFYLDLLVGSSVAYVVGTFLEVDKFHWPLSLGIWFVLEYMLHHPFGQSFGRYAMGVVHTGSGEMVDAELAEKQHGFLVALGILMVLSASKLVARGFSQYTFFYLADHRFTGVSGRLMWLLLAAATVWAAASLFRMKAHAPWAVMAMTLFVLVNDGLSPNALTDHAAEYKAAREATRGRSVPISPATMAYVRLVGGAIWAAVLGLILFALRRRFGNESEPAGVSSNNPIS